MLPTILLLRAHTGQIVVHATQTAAALEYHYCEIGRLHDLSDPLICIQRSLAIAYVPSCCQFRVILYI